LPRQAKRLPYNSFGNKVETSVSSVAFQRPKNIDSEDVAHEVSLKASKPQSLKASKPQSLKASKPQSLKATLRDYCDTSAAHGFEQER
jgi:hypothetical protein